MSSKYGIFSDLVDSTSSVYDTSLGGKNKYGVFQDLVEASSPDSSEFLEKVLPVRQTPVFSGTSLRLDYRQRAAERAAGTETRRIRTEAYAAGRGEEFEDYMEKGGAGIGAAWDYSMEHLLDPTFDLLSIGNYGVAGAVQEYLRTGSTWDAFKQAGYEFYNALPGLESPKARRPSFIDVFGEHGAGRWEAAVGGLVIDFVLDPINLVPGMALAKGLGRGARAIGEASPEIAKLAERSFWKRFRLKGTKEGQATLEHFQRYEAARANELVEWQDRLDDFFSDLTPHESRLLAVYLDSDEGFQRIREAEKAGLIPKGAEQRAVDILLGMQKYTDEMFWGATEGGRFAPGEVHYGLVHPLMYNARYRPRGEAVGGKLSRVEKRIIRERTGRDLPSDTRRGATLGSSPPMSLLGKVLPEARRREYKTTVGRMRNILYGDAEETLELDIRNAMKRRVIDHIEWINQRRFLDDVIDDPRISRPALWQGRQLTEGQLNHPSWARRREQIIRDNPGYNILEPTRRTAKGGTRITGAHLVPDVVHQFVTRGDAAFDSPEAMSGFFQFVHNWTNVWKGWATVGNLMTAYLLRNKLSSDMMSWLAGVGNKYGDVVKGKWPAPGKSMNMRYLQATRVLMVANGAGRAPKRVKEALDGIASSLGKAGFSDVPVPKFKDEHGNAMQSWGDVARLGERWGLPQVANRVFDLPEGIERKMWEELGDAVPVEDVLTAPVSSLTKDALLLGRVPRSATGANLGKPTGAGAVVEAVVSGEKRLRELLGDNAMIRAGRALATMSDNQARWALFIDRMEKGATPYEAVISAKTWHFEYSNMTTFEKKWLRTMLPFYAWCVPDDCEILTREGWKFVDQLCVGESVLSLDPDTYGVGWGPLEDVAIFPYAGELLAIGSKREEFLCTPGHKWPVERYTTVAGKHCRVREIRVASSLHSSCRVPRVGEFKETASLLSNRDAAIIGWLVTDGHMRRRGNHVEMVIYQSPSKYLDDILALLGKDASVGDPHPTSGVIPVRIVGHTRSKIQRLMPDKEKVVSVVCQLGRQAAEAMLDTMLKAEGSFGVREDRGGWQGHFAQQPGPVLDAFQILAQLCGRVAHISNRGAYVSPPDGERKHLKAEIKGSRWYSGRVWCPTTVEGTWLMRRGGRVVWTGNSRFNVPRQIMAMIENPGRYSRIPKIKNAIESLSADWEGIQRPDYFDEVQAVATGLVHNDRPVFAQLDLPVMDLNRLGISQIASGLHPMTKMFEWVPKGGYSFFMEAPIEKFPGELSEGLPVSRKTEAFLSTLFPPLGKVSRGLRAKARGELSEQVFSELTGVRARALDVRRITRANTFRKRALAREFAQRD